MIDLREIRSVTEFQRNIKDYIGRLKEKKTPLVLTVNGRAELVVQDAESYQLLMERLERAETQRSEAPASIPRSVEQFERAADGVEKPIRKSHGFSRPRRLRIWK